MGYSASFERLPISACFDLKGSSVALIEWTRVVGNLPDFPTAPNRLIRGDRMWLGHVGPNNWLLWADIDRENELMASLRPHDAPAEISIVLVSDTFATFRIVGDDAAHVVAVGCPLDLHASVFVDDSVSFSEFFGQKALLKRCDGGFDVSVEASFGAMIEDFLSRVLR